MKMDRCIICDGEMPDRPDWPHQRLWTCSAECYRQYRTYREDGYVYNEEIKDFVKLKLPTRLRGCITRASRGKVGI